MAGPFFGFLAGICGGCRGSVAGVRAGSGGVWAEFGGPGSTVKLNLSLGFLNRAKSFLWKQKLAFRKPFKGAAHQRAAISTPL